LANNYLGTPRPRYRFNYFGANLGGPIKKNKYSSSTTTKSFCRTIYTVINESGFFITRNNFCFNSCGIFDFEITSPLFSALRKALVAKKQIHQLRHNRPFCFELNKCIDCTA